MRKRRLIMSLLSSLDHRYVYAHSFGSKTEDRRRPIPSDAAQKVIDISDCIVPSLDSSARHVLL